MRHANQTSTTHQPAPRKPAKRDTVLAAQLHRYAEAVKLAKATGGKAPNVSNYVDFSKGKQ